MGIFSFSFSAYLNGDKAIRFLCLSPINIYLLIVILGILANCIPMFLAFFLEVGMLRTTSGQCFNWEFITQMLIFLLVELAKFLWSPRTTWNCAGDPIGVQHCNIHDKNAGNQHNSTREHPWHLCPMALCFLLAPAWAFKIK